MVNDILSGFIHCKSLFKSDLETNSESEEYGVVSQSINKYFLESLALNTRSHSSAIGIKQMAYPIFFFFFAFSFNSLLCNSFSKSIFFFKSPSSYFFSHLIITAQREEAIVICGHLISNTTSIFVTYKQVTCI